MRQAARQVAARLAGAGIEGASFEAEVLTRKAAAVDRADFYLDRTLGQSDSDRLAAWAERRVAREPLPYITGHREFYGREFAVGPGVLVPRPETELLVELALRELTTERRLAVVEVGTGSGAVAVSIAAEAPWACIVATEISALALEFARANAARHAPSVAFVLGNLLDPVRRADLVVANLPYIPTWEIDALEPEVSKWEPRIALDGGADGMSLIRRLVEDCQARVRPRLLALEVGFGQAAPLCDELRSGGHRPTVAKDLSGIDRVVCLRWE